MKGIIFDIRRGVTNDGPGFRTSVFLKGCPLRCAWCHNPESQSPEIQTAIGTGEVCGREVSVGEVLDEVRRDLVFYVSTGGGMTITGGEPMMQADFAFELAASARKENIHVALDTSGFASWPALEKMAGVVDLFLYDLKCIDPQRHLNLTGVGNGKILDNLRRLDAAGVKTWIRCPLVPDVNDSDDNLVAIRDFVSSLENMEKLEICPYHALGLEKYQKFGMVSPYPVRDEPTARDVARWRSVLGISGRRS